MNLIKPLTEYIKKRFALMSSCVGTIV